VVLLEECLRTLEIASISAVAAAINHLMVEAATAIPEISSSLVLLSVTVITMTVVVGFIRVSGKRP